jgi:hypothetical protein
MRHGRELIYSRKLTDFPNLPFRAAVPAAGTMEGQIDALWCEHFCRLTRLFRSDSTVAANRIRFKALPQDNFRENIEPSLIDLGSQKSSGTFWRSWKIPLTQPASLTNL